MFCVVGALRITQHVFLLSLLYYSHKNMRANYVTFISLVCIGWNFYINPLGMQFYIAFVSCGIIERCGFVSIRRRAQIRRSKRSVYLIPKDRNVPGFVVNNNISNHVSSSLIKQHWFSCKR